jgi:hypothetical protein
MLLISLRVRERVIGKKGEESKFLRTMSEPKIILLQIELIFQDFINL